MGTWTCGRCSRVSRTWPADPVPETPAEDLLRELAPQVLGALVRRYGHFDTAEDAVQEALIAAAHGWPRDGVPDNPRGWLITVASRRLTDLLRREQARHAAGGHGGPVGAAGAVARPGRRPSAGGRRRHAHPAVPVLPPGAVAGVADRAHPAGGGRAEHRRGGARVPGAGGDDDPADQPGQAADPRQWAAVRAADRPGARRPARRRAARALPDLHGGVRPHGRPRLAARRPDRRGDPADPAGAPAAARRSRGHRAARVDAAHRRPRAGADSARTASWCRWPSRTAAGGGPTRSPRGSS